MSINSENTPLMRLARRGLKWLLTSGQELVVTQEEIALLASITGATLSVNDMPRLANKLRDTERFRNGGLALGKRWQQRWPKQEPPGIEQAQAFIHEFLELIDHSIFFDQDVIASHTHMKRGSTTASQVDIDDGMPCWTLHLTTAGGALFLNESMELEVGRGHLMLFQPKVHYHYGLAPTAGEWSHLWALFQPLSHWHEWLNWETTDQGICHKVLPGEDCTAELEALFLKLISLKEGQIAYRSELEYNLLEEILIRIRGHHYPASAPTIDKRVVKACCYIEKKQPGDFCVDELAEFCNMSSSRLAHLFKLHMGMGPKAWSINLKLQRARRLLLKDARSISVVANQVGYEDLSHFTRSFKKNVGCSPREFRKLFGVPGILPPKKTNSA